MPVALLLQLEDETLTLPRNSPFDLAHHHDHQPVAFHVHHVVLQAHEGHHYLPIPLEFFKHCPYTDKRKGSVLLLS